MSPRNISIRGARTHNLKNISVEIPQRVLTVVTGPSGSGKSSLAFDTLYAEGQRRFVESMSTYVRQFLEQMERPDVDSIEGVLPSIAIEQKNSVKNARSTVATATELADYMRLFMTYCGETFCPRCEVRVKRESPETVTRHALSAFDGRRIVVLAPLFFASEEAKVTAVQQLIKGGYYRAWVDGAIADLKELDLRQISSLEMMTGRLRVGPEQHDALAEAIEQAFQLSGGLVNVMEQSGEFWLSHRFSSRFVCDRCGDEFPDPSPHLFSFNSPLGACVECQGYGRVMGIDLEKVIPVRSQRLDERPIAPWNSPGYEDCYDDLEKAAKKYKLRLDVPIERLTPDEWQILYNGRGKWYGIKGFFDWLETKKYKIHVRVKIAKYRAYTECSSCGGSRLKNAARNIRFRDLDISGLLEMSVGAARHFWEFVPLSKEEEALAGHLRREILNRLVYLDEVGLSYLTLERQTRTLSGGESQRINLAASLGSALTETLYVIDEPTVGLHARDSERLLAVLRRLRNSGNTVVVVEHDPTIIAGADHVIALGPGAGELGGEILSEGKPSEVLTNDADPETSYRRREADPENAITIVNAREHNLKGVTASIPLNLVVAITGVSGSGKSTLIRDCLYNIYQRVHRAGIGFDVGKVDRIEGIDRIDDMQLVDQSPIGRSSRSNPATYTKAWDEIRKLLAETTAAKVNVVTAGMFSFNTNGGRCDTCSGAGTVIIDMQFLADVEVLCDTCGGRRFKDSVLKVTYRGKNADAILELTVDEAIRFFIDRRAIVKKLASLRAVGLGYLRLGQSTATLSGGEAQRLKLASFLGAGDKMGSRRLFLFDEPTTGLHSTDVRQLIRTFRQLVDRGNSVVVIEHNIQMIEASDYVIDLGPDGGDGGGELVASGTPEEVAANPRSITGSFLFRSASATPAPSDPQASVLK